MGNKNTNKTIIIGRNSAIDISNRGGTEEIARYFLREESASTLKENEFSYRELSRSSSKEKIKIILLGASKIRAIQIFLSQILLPNVKIQFIKSSYRN